MENDLIFEMHLLNQKTIADCTEKIKVDPNNIEAYIERGDAYVNENQDEKAIDDLTKAIELGSKSSSVFFQRGCSFFSLEKFENAIEDLSMAITINPDDVLAYLNRGELYRESKQYERAIADYSKAIVLGSEFDSKMNSEIEKLDSVNQADYIDSTVYYRRGLSYSLLHQYKKAIDDYSIAIKMRPSYCAGYYFARGICFNQLQQVEDCFYDYNSYLYIAVKEGRIKYINTLVDFFEYSYPQNINTITKITEGNSLVIFNLKKVSDSVYGSYLDLLESLKNASEINEDDHLWMFDPLKKALENVDGNYLDLFESLKNVSKIDENNDLDMFVPFKKASDKVQDFTLILDFFGKKKLFDVRSFLSIKAIIHYYLGGSVSSYIIYDEKLDAEGSKLTSQELYYYALSSIDVHLDHDTVINNCIHEIELDSDIDKYYLAHLYLLQNNTEKAIDNFKESISFIFSEIMLTYLTGDDQYTTKLRNKELPRINNSIDLKIDFLTQFEPYFHYKECFDAINYLNENSNFSFYNMRDMFFWEIYHLDISTRENLKKEIREIDLKIVAHQLHDEFIEVLNKNKPKNIDNRTIELHDYLFKKGKIKVNTNFESLERRRSDKIDLENQLGKIIKENPSEPKLYLYFIEYFFLNDDIDQEQTFTLFLYLTNNYSIEKYKVINKSTKELIIIIIVSLAKLIMPNIILKSTIGLIQNLIPIFQNMSNDNNDFELEKSTDYEIFKNNLWNFISLEYNNLSEEQFSNKYRAFQWFDTYKFK